MEALVYFLTKCSRKTFFTVSQCVEGWGWAWGLGGTAISINIVKGESLFCYITMCRGDTVAIRNDRGKEEICSTTSQFVEWRGRGERG